MRTLTRAQGDPHLSFGVQDQEHLGDVVTGASRYSHRFARGYLNINIIVVCEGLAVSTLLEFDSESAGRISILIALMDQGYRRPVEVRVLKKTITTRNAATAEHSMKRSIQLPKQGTT
jgi:hypothetical protein